jgi:hypothetical protein
MLVIRGCALLLAFSIMGANVFATQPAQISVWPVDSLTKVFPNDSPGTHLGTLDFWAARGQHVSIQFAIRSTKALTNLSAEVNLKNAKGEILDGSTVRQVGYVVVGSHTDDTPADELIGEAPGWYPDPLWNLPMDLDGNRTHPLWVTLAVPSDAASGSYRGTLLVRGGEKAVARKEFRLHVVAATVPSQRTLKVTNWFNVGDAASRQFYGAPQFSDPWWTLIENLGTVMSEHRQNMVITPLMDLITPHVDGSALTYDFSNFDRWVETFRRAGVVGYIEGGHLLGRAGSYDAALTVPAFVIENGKVSHQDLAPDDPRVEPYLTSLLSALNTHLTEKNWKSIYFQHILDEPHGAEPPQYARVAELVHRYLPGVLTMDAIDASEMRSELRNNCDIWVPQLGRFDSQMT